jgi:hypothetical protein
LSTKELEDHQKNSINFFYTWTGNFHGCVLKSKPAFKSSPLPTKAQLSVNNQAHKPINLHLLSAARPTTHKAQLHISSQAQQPPSPS